ncbi:hypothetical protein FQN55_006136 [Onygenales sp. PD_40]|nr:hypothetical protein FQN55_006136 [Onygenales sp. PD_40]
MELDQLKLQWGSEDGKEIGSRHFVSPNFSRPSPTNSTASQHSPVPSTHRKAHVAQSVPSGFGHLLHPQPSSSPPPAVPSRPRLRLFIRQQPTQARACGAGDKCRRPVDPLPIVQLLMMDFSPHSEEDARHLISPQYVVACQLYSIPKGHEDDSDRQLLYPSTAEHYLDRSQAGRVSGDPGSELQTRQVRILSGSIHASSFSVDEDPEPARAPSHPRSAPNSEINPAIHSGPIPAVFFIFPDLCVRTAGHYRLRFSLIDIVSTMSGHPQWAPILHEAWSQPFQVFPAKDFPGMKATPYLTMQLKTLGASGITTRKEPRGQRGRMDTQSGSEEQNEGDED